jgi:Ricin-type beta-trefoil lectin domain/Peptidase_C39 like family
MNIYKYVSIVFLLTSVVFSTNITVFGASKTLICPEELVVCNETTLKEYTSPSLNNEIEEEASNYGALSISNAYKPNAINNSVPSITANHLMLPYFNQYVDENNDIFGTRYHCGAAASVMVSGYFKRLPYNGEDDTQFKKYMNSNSGQGVPETCKGQGGAFGITGYPSTCKASYPQGVSNYLKRMGLNYKFIAGYGAGLGKLNINQVKNAIDRGNPIIISSNAHYYTIKGYTTDGRVIVNDSWKDGANSASSSFIHGNGKNAIYDLNNLYPYNKASYQDIRFAWEVSTKDESFYYSKVKTVNPIFKNEEQVYYSPKDGDLNPLNVRESAGGDIKFNIKKGSKGNVIDGPYFAKGEGWYKIKWEDGSIGWSSKSFLTSNNNTDVKEEEENINPSEITKLKVVFKIGEDKKMCLDIPEGKVKQSQIVQIWICNNTNAQEWIKEIKGGDNLYRSVINNKYCLDFNGKNLNPTVNKPIIVSLCNNGDKSSSMWNYSNNTLKPKNNNKLCVISNGNKVSYRNKLDLQNCFDSQNPIFEEIKK